MKLQVPGQVVEVPLDATDEDSVVIAEGIDGMAEASAQQQQVVEDSGVRVTRTETLPGLIPIGYVEGTFGPG